MKSFLILGIAALIGYSQSHTCGDAPMTNGCNAWDIVPYKSYFREQCNMHDVCYSCGQTFGISFDKCNDKFHDDLYDRCDSWWCNVWAKLYYKAVDWFGRGYKNPSPSWCKQETWIKEQCLP